MAKKVLQKDQKCKVPDCSNDARIRMMCPKHYRRFKLYGDPSIQVKASVGNRTICKVPDCAGPVQSGGLCNKHHRRFLKYGSWERSALKKAPPGALKNLICKVPDCGRPASSTRDMLCNNHHTRMKIHGTVSDDVLVNFRSLPLSDRLMRSIKKNKETDCWEWQRGLFSNGYGQITINKKNTLAHRASYEEFVGSIPEGILVLHKCDNPICINPDHLFLGTNQDNMTDMVNKGRSARGEKNGRAKLTESEVAFIRRKLSEGKDAFDLSEQFNVSLSTIGKIQSYQTWKFV